MKHVEVLILISTYSYMMHGFRACCTEVAGKARRTAQGTQVDDSSIAPLKTELLPDLYIF